MRLSKHILPSFHGYKIRYLKNDLIGGIIVAALCIPVAMGYAQIAGLPPVYGLYASILPVLGYVLFASSPQTVFGIDAASSAVTGSTLAAMGIAAGSPEAVTAAPVLALFAGIFLVLFAALRVGRFVHFISATVMSGFISGISLSIIVGQVPKILGLSGGKNFFQDMAAIFGGLGQINLMALGLGAATIALILLGKKFLRKAPMALIALVLGTLASAWLRMDQHGVAIVGSIPSGLPSFGVPHFWDLGTLGSHLSGGLMVAVVVFAGSLLPSLSFAERGGYALDSNQEIFATGFSNLTAAFFGCPPTSASVSRTAASEQYHGKSQLVSVVSAVIIVLVVRFLSALLYYMPQPVLSGIVLAALVGVLDVKLLRRLIRRSRSDAILWVASVVAVLFVGILYGAILSITLSFVDVLRRVLAPPQAFLGRDATGQDDYVDLKRPGAAPIPGVSIYRFSAPLFFANAGLFTRGVDQALEAHPKVLIVDASGIGSIDLGAADELRKAVDRVHGSGVAFYVAGAIGRLKDDFRKLGLSAHLPPGHVTRTIGEALAASEAEQPQPPDGTGAA